MHAHTLKYYFHGPAAAAAGRRCVCVSRYRDFTSGPPGRRAGPGGIEKTTMQTQMYFEKKDPYRRGGPQPGPARGRYQGREADALASEVDEGRGKLR